MPTGRDAIQLLVNFAHGVQGAFNRSDLTARLYDHISAHRQRAEVYEDEYFSIKYFMKGSAHLTFKKTALMDKMNDIIAKHYPQALPAR